MSADQTVPDAVLAAIAGRHGRSLPDLRLLEGQGVANRTFAMGEHLVLRVARPGFEQDLAREAAVLPVVHRAHVLAPALVDYDPGGGPRPAYFVQERRRGVPLSAGVLSVLARQRGYQDLGRVLRHLHETVPPPPEIDIHLQPDPRLLLDDLRAGKWIGAADAQWLGSWFDRLRSWLPDQEPVVLLHGDAAPANVLIDATSGAVTGLLDWGDTAVSDPAVDLAKIPPCHLPDAVAGYAGASVDRQDPAEELAWAARALRHHLAWALGRLSTRPRPEDPTWSAPPGARLLGVLRLLAHPPTSWTALLPPPCP